MAAEAAEALAEHGGGPGGGCTCAECSAPPFTLPTLSVPVPDPAPASEPLTPSAPAPACAAEDAAASASAAETAGMSGGDAVPMDEDTAPLPLVVPGTPAAADTDMTDGGSVPAAGPAPSPALPPAEPELDPAAVAAEVAAAGGLEGEFARMVWRRKV